MGTAKHGSFQKYATTREQVVAKIPDDMTFEQGAVLPIAISTSSVGLFDILKLSPPSIEPKSAQGTVLIWGASSSLGSVGIQLAKAAGYEVIATASSKNHEYAKALGASEVFDYKQPDVVEQIKKSLTGRKLVGVYDTIGEDGTPYKCADVLSSFGGGELAVALWPPQDLPANVKATLSKLSHRKHCRVLMTCQPLQRPLVWLTAMPMPRYGMTLCPRHWLKGSSCQDQSPLWSDMASKRFKMQ